MNPNTTVSDAESSIVQEVFALVKENLSEAQRRKDAASGERATAPFVASARSDPGARTALRTQR
jgi:hypothetical protein